MSCLNGRFMSVLLKRSLCASRSAYSTTGSNTLTPAERDAGWKLLGTADHAPYRVYHDLTGLPAAVFACTSGGRSLACANG